MDDIVNINIVGYEPALGFIGKRLHQPNNLLITPSKNVGKAYDEKYPEGIPSSFTMTLKSG